METYVVNYRYRMGQFPFRYGDERTIRIESKNESSAIVRFMDELRKSLILAARTDPDITGIEFLELTKRIDISKQAFNVAINEPGLLERHLSDAQISEDWQLRGR